VFIAPILCDHSVFIAPILCDHSVFIAPILCDHSMCMEPLVFSELVFPSEVHQNISLIDLLYVVKKNHIGTFLGLQPVIWFLFLATKKQGREFRHLPSHNAETVMSGPEFLLSTRFLINNKDPYPLLGLHMLSYEHSSTLQSSLFENYKMFMCVNLQIVANRSDLMFCFRSPQLFSAFLWFAHCAHINCSACQVSMRNK